MESVLYLMENNEIEEFQIDNKIAERIEGKI